MLATRLWYPVYDRHLAWVGIRLETDHTETVDSELLEHISQSAHAIENMGRKLFFINASLLSVGGAALDQFFQPDQLHIILDQPFLQQTALLPLASQWQQQGAKLALESLDPAPGPLNNHIAARILNAAASRAQYGDKTLLNASRSPARLFAWNIGSLPLFKWCSEVGFSYFTFAGLDCLQEPGKTQNPSSLPIMQLLSLVARDADIDQMEEVFKRDPKLAFELLRLVNSAAFGIHREITSFAQAIMLLGQRQLQRWLQLLMYAQPQKNTGPNILMQRAAERGRMMELLAGYGSEKVNAEQAFMVGVFSVLDVLMSTPLKTLLQSILLPKPVELALLERQGRLGQLLNLICATESNSFTTVRRLLDDLGISSDQLSETQLDAIFWALKIARSS